MARRLPLFSLIGFASLLGVAPSLADSGTTAAPMAKDFTLVDITGRTRTLAEQKGKVVVLSFWATWCGPCRLELPRLHDVYKRHKRDAFELYAVAVDNGATVALVPALVEQMRLSFPVLLDTNNRVVMQYNNQGIIPYTVIVDKQGRIRHVHPGYAPGQEVQVEREIVELLSEGESTPGKPAENTTR